MHAETQDYSAESRARQLFLDNPGLSIDDAARLLAHQGSGLTKGIISRIRMEVRQAIDRGFVKTQVRPTPVIIRRHGQPVVPRPQPVVPKPPFNPPRLALPQEEPAPVVQPVVPIQVQPQPIPTAPADTNDMLARLAQPRVPEPDRAARLRFLEDWVLANPGASVNKARQALLDKFGMTLSTTLINNTLKLVKDAVAPRFEPRIAVPEEPVREFDSVNDLVTAMRRLGVKKVEVLGDHYLIQMN